VERANACDLRGARGREHAAAGRRSSDLRRPAAGREESGPRFDLDDGATAEPRDLAQEIVVGEHGTREKHASESSIDRTTRLVDARDAARETARNAGRARDLTEELEIAERARLGRVQVDEMKLLGAFCDEAARALEDGRVRSVAEPSPADVERRQDRAEAELRGGRDLHDLATDRGTRFSRASDLSIDPAFPRDCVTADAQERQQILDDRAERSHRARGADIEAFASDVRERFSAVVTDLYTVEAEGACDLLEEARLLSHRFDERDARCRKGDA